MSSLATWPILVAVMIALVTVSLLARWLPILHGEPGRVSAIDGLRGYLALFVFLHHAITWRFFAIDGEWTAPDSRIFLHAGKSSVMLFFMITGFLFFSKLLKTGGAQNWFRLYVSRILRIWPLYLCAVALVLVVVAIKTSLHLSVAPYRLAIEILKWMFFLGTPDINGLQSTELITAGVIWSLKYEWLFYMALPVLAFFSGRQASLIWLVISAFLLVLAVPIFRPSLLYLTTFLGGMIAAWLATQDYAVKALRTGAAAAVTVICVVVVVTQFRTPQGLVQIALLSIAFATIGCGNPLFGLLTSKPSRALGEIAYGIYLLHGIMLYVLFDLVVGRDALSHLSILEHWVVVWMATPALVALAVVALLVIERPALRKVDTVMSLLRNPLSRLALHSTR